MEICITLVEYGMDICIACHLIRRLYKHAFLISLENKNPLS